MKDPVTIDDYQVQSRKSIIQSIFPQTVGDIKYVTIAITEEAGEIAGKIKKLIRDKKGKLDDEAKEGLIKEIGDVQWYLARLCDLIDVPMSRVLKTNMEKIMSRKDRGAIHGSGDDR